MTYNEVGTSEIYRYDSVHGITSLEYSGPNFDPIKLEYSYDPDLGWVDKETLW